jgi:hypothetical protein
MFFESLNYPHEPAQLSPYWLEVAEQDDGRARTGTLEPILPTKKAHNT